MSFEERELSRYEGRPVECFKFVMGATTWRYTSADRAVTLPDGTYEMETIEGGEPSWSDEVTSESVTITVPLENPVAQALLPARQAETIWLTIYKVHRGEEDEPLAVFLGTVASALASETKVTLTCASISGFLDRQIPVLAVQTQCNHGLYSKGCGLSKTGVWKKTVSIESVDGVTVVSTGFADLDDQYFRGGLLESSTGEVRFIVDHVGDTVTLLSPMASLAAAQYAQAYWGCDHLESTCLRKFGNLIHHLGFSRMPGRNPFAGRID